MCDEFSGNLKPSLLETATDTSYDGPNMLFMQHILEGIAEGRVTLSFRRWKRPTVKAGGTLRTPVGVLSIRSVDPMNSQTISVPIHRSPVEVYEFASNLENSELRQHNLVELHSPLLDCFASAP